jgi:hypothetical protein
MQAVPPRGPRHRSRGEPTGQRGSGALAVTAQIQRRARGEPSGGPPDPGRCSGRAARQGHAGRAGPGIPAAHRGSRHGGTVLAGVRAGRCGLARTSHAAGQDPLGPGEGDPRDAGRCPARSVTAGDNTARSPPGPDVLCAPLRHGSLVIFQAKPAGARWVRTAVLRAGDRS